MRRIYGALSLLLLSLLFLQCQREVSYVGGPDNPGGEIALPDPITAALQGNVFDENDAPAVGVTVQVGSKTAITDAKGFFRINNASLDKNSAVVTASKTGYFKAFRTFGATAGSNNIEFKLIKKTVAGNVDASVGGEVSLNNGTKVALTANGIVNAATNAAYTGQVKVYAAYIDPTAADIRQTVPGSFMADDKDGKRVVLTSYGMVAVELEGASGERLQIKSGSTATLTTAIPSSAQATAPATIALWSVDESTGIWKEEGTATKNGSVYVGQVKHFSFWNCDVSQNAIKFSLKLQLPGGEAFVHAQVRIKRNNNGYNSFGYGMTDSLGQVSGYVPYNESLILEVLDRCGQPFFSQNIGPFTQSTNLGAITVNNPGTAVITLKGKLVTCSNTPVASGYAIVTFGYYVRYVHASATGDFQTTFTNCVSNAAGFSIIGVDSTAQTQSASATTVAITSPLTDAGNVSACGASASQFINYTVDGNNFSLTNITDSLVGYSYANQQGTNTYTSMINAFTMTNSSGIAFSWQGGPSAGNYPLSYISLNTGISTMDSLTIIQPFNVNLTSFPSVVGGFYDGSFSGQVRDRSNVTHTLSATFRVRRIQ